MPTDRPPTPAESPIADDPTLATVMDAWPVLSKNMRAVVVGIVDDVAPYTEGWSSRHRPHPDLAVVVKAWPMLPETICAELLGEVSVRLAIRWRSAVHEAGHAVVALALGGGSATSDRTVRAALNEHLGGRCGWTGVGGLDGASVAYWIYVAGGPVAVTLIDKLGPPPELPRRPADDDGSQPAAGDLARADHQAWLEKLPEGRLDERSLALSVIDGLEKRPEAWAQRHADILAAARAVLERNLPALAAAAARLYLEGGFAIKTLDELNLDGVEGER